MRRLAFLFERLSTVTPLHLDDEEALLSPYEDQTAGDRPLGTRQLEILQKLRCGLDPVDTADSIAKLCDDLTRLEARSLITSDALGRYHLTQSGRDLLAPEEARRGDAR